MQPKNTAIVLFAHGARDPEWALPFEKLRHLVAEQKPGVSVQLAFLELMRPSLEEAIHRLADSAVNRVRIFPLFLAQGGHLKHDLPLLVSEIKERHPALTLEIAPPLGEVERILEFIAQWVCASS
jgi:sirohydrochlorin cobaltochelatase